MLAPLLRTLRLAPRVFVCAFVLLYILSSFNWPHILHLMAALLAVAMAVCAPDE